MPLYEYVCNGCKQVFSVLKLKVSNEGEACPQCGSRDVVKQFSTFSTGGFRASSGSFSHGGG